MGVNCLFVSTLFHRMFSISLYEVYCIYVMLKISKINHAKKSKNKQIYIYTVYVYVPKVLHLTSFLFAGICGHMFSPPA